MGLVSPGRLGRARLAGPVGLMGGVWPAVRACPMGGVRLARRVGRAGQARRCLVGPMGIRGRTERTCTRGRTEPMGIPGRRALTGIPGPGVRTGTPGRTGWGLRIGLVGVGGPMGWVFRVRRAGRVLAGRVLAGRVDLDGQLGLAGRLGRLVRVGASGRAAWVGRARLTGRWGRRGTPDRWDQAGTLARAGRGGRARLAGPVGQVGTLDRWGRRGTLGRGRLRTGMAGWALRRVAGGHRPGRCGGWIR